MDPNPPKPILPNLNLPPPDSPDQQLPVPHSPQPQPPNFSPPPPNYPPEPNSPPQQPQGFPPQPQLSVQDPRQQSPEDSWPDPDASPQQSWPEEPQPSPPHEYLVETPGGVFTVTLPHSPRSLLRPDVLSTPETSDSLPGSSDATPDTASGNTSPLPPSQ